MKFMQELDGHDPFPTQHPLEAFKQLDQSQTLSKHYEIQNAYLASTKRKKFSWSEDPNRKSTI